MEKNNYKWEKNALHVLAFLPSFMKALQLYLSAYLFVHSKKITLQTFCMQDITHVNI